MLLSTNTFFLVIKSIQKQHPSKTQQFRCTHGFLNLRTLFDAFRPCNADGSCGSLITLKALVRPGSWFWISISCTSTWISPWMFWPRAKNTIFHAKMNDRVNSKTVLCSQPLIVTSCVTTMISRFVSKESINEMGNYLLSNRLLLVMTIMGNRKSVCIVSVAELRFGIALFVANYLALLNRWACLERGLCYIICVLLFLSCVCFVFTLVKKNNKNLKKHCKQLIKKNTSWKRNVYTRK